MGSFSKLYKIIFNNFNNSYIVYIIIILSVAPFDTLLIYIIIIYNKNFDLIPISINANNIYIYKIFIITFFLILYRIAVEPRY